MIVSKFMSQYCSLHLFTWALTACNLILACPVQAHPSCGSLEKPCEIASGVGGRYYAYPPNDWDGKRSHGALLFFHGYQSSGAAFINNVELRNAARREDHFLIAADGVNGTWSHTGSPTQKRNELEYVSGLVADLTKRFSILHHDIWLAGFSQGGSMVWEVACHMGGRFKAFVPIAGAFWKPLPPTCAGGPVSILHIHGTDDRTVPMTGRQIGPYRQGDVMKAWDLMKTIDRCSQAPQSISRIGIYNCQAWTDCKSEHRMELCLHEHGHNIPTNWADLAHGFLSKLRK